MESLIPDYDTESSPFVIEAEDGALNSWPCAHWSLSEWAKQYGSVKFKFRVHKKKKSPSSEVNWENEAEGYVEATVAHLLEHVQGTSISAEKSTDSTTTTEPNDANPFKGFPAEEYCFYSAYNYMNSLSEASLLNSVRWSETGLFGPLGDGEDDARKSTLWLGTTGAYTPCHMDTYGFNFVGQLTGRLVG